MTTHRDTQQHARLRRIGAALVMAAGAILVALSIVGVLIATDVIEQDYEGYPWPVYAVLMIASAALFWKGLRDWREYS